jgi:DNA-binding transcriptional LysR family regulator
MRFGSSVDREWAFSEAGKRTVMTVSGNRIANDGSLVRQWCIAGHGIALKSYWDIKDDLASGALQEILSSYSATQNNIQVVYQGGRAIPKRVRALIDAFVKTFSQENSTKTSANTQ